MEDQPCTSKEADKIQQQVKPKRWTRDLKLLPPFTHDILQKHFGIGNSESAHKHKKLGYQLFKDRYVKKLEVKANVRKDSDELYLIKGCVDASMKKTSYVVYVHLNQATGEVIHSHCLCKAGKGGCCKHVAALLFQILDYIQLELTEVPDDLTCTQLLQQWHVPRNDESEIPILYEDINFEKASYEKDISGRRRSTTSEKRLDYNPMPHFARHASQNKISDFANKLEQEGKADYLRQVLQSNNCQPFPFEEFHNNLPSKKRCKQENTCDLHQCNVRDQILENLEKCAVNWSYVGPDNIQFVEDSLCTTHTQLLEIERNTRGQSSCDKWYEERKLRLTASNFGAVMKRRRNIHPKSLLKTLLANQSTKSNCPTPCKWGRDNEEAAAKLYVKSKKHQDCNVILCSSCGLIVNKTFPWLGASPDFLVCDMHEEASPLGLGEIKCPYSKRENSILEACEDPQFFLCFSDGKVSLKRQHAYYYQLQGLMATAYVQWCDFVVFTKKDLHVERVYFDNDFWERTMVPELTSFYFDYLLPHIKI